MPVPKSRLSRAEEADHAYYLVQMQSEGVEVEIPEESQENLQALDIVMAGPAESVVFESPSGGVRYAVFTRFVARRSGLILTDWDMTTDWDDQIVPESFDGGSPIYKLGHQEYRRCEVLNQQIAQNLTLGSGQIVEGWVLANGLRPIPPDYHDCSAAHFEIRFLDQFGCEHPARGTLLVLRRLQLQDTASVLPGTGLYGGDDSGKPRELSVCEESALRYRELVRQEKARSEPRDS